MDEIKKKMPEYFKENCFFYYKWELLEKGNMETFEKEMMCNFEPENIPFNGEKNG